MLNQSMRQTSAIATILLTLMFACSAEGQTSPKWRIVGPGGGGTMIGPTISPFDSRVVFEHCDMSGAYVTPDSGLSWYADS